MFAVNEFPQDSEKEPNITYLKILNRRKLKTLILHKVKLKSKK